jgi:hypothetical protein
VLGEQQQHLKLWQPDPQRHVYVLQETNNKWRFNIPYGPMNIIRILIPMSSEDGRCAGYKKMASNMRQYLELKIYDTVKVFWEDHNVKDLEGRKSISTLSMLAFPDHP